ncbi:MAG TPA: hypothetical protein VEF90_13710 [Xanthobacteraceae bacterium]|nr:hypothetical protein [Xanthobacteraceae bacterium]
MNMKRSTIAAVLAVAMSCPVIAEERQGERPSESQRQFAPSLALVMDLMQLSHFKLWMAGNLRNWPLADYELVQMNTSLQEARTLFPNVPKADTRSMLQPAEAIRGAISAKDGAGFDKAYAEFTAACNRCHEAEGLGFIDIKVPLLSPIMTSPFSDQSFAPK